MDEIAIVEQKRGVIWEAPFGPIRVISFVVPAHNEEVCLPATLRAIHESAVTTEEAYEIIVVDDASTDATAEIAGEFGTRVVQVNHRQIAATRNSGARAAQGERIFFVDADTIINPRAVAECLSEMDKGAVGGGGLVKVDGEVPFYVQLMMLAFYLPAKLGGFCGGAFMYCTREAFHATGGFNEKLYWGEEGFFGFALKRLGRFVVIWRPVLTSGRRFRALPFRAVLRFFGHWISHPLRIFTDRSLVREIWYDSNRQHDNKPPSEIGFRVANFFGLLIMVSLVTGPLWYFIPWSVTPLSTALGKARFVNAVFLIHASLIFWPISIWLVRNLMRFRISREWLRMSLILALCWWQALEASFGMFTIWSRFFRWIAA